MPECFTEKGRVKKIRKQFGQKIPGHKHRLQPETICSVLYSQSDMNVKQAIPPVILKDRTLNEFENPKILLKVQLIPHHFINRYNNVS